MLSRPHNRDTGTRSNPDRDVGVILHDAVYKALRLELHHLEKESVALRCSARAIEVELYKRQLSLWNDNPTFDDEPQAIQHHVAGDVEPANPLSFLHQSLPPPFFLSGIVC